MSKVLKIAGVSILALGLILGLALPALAAPPWARPWADDSQIEMVGGKVISIDDQEFVIQSGEQELTISIDGDTKYFKLCVPRQIVSLARHQMRLRLQDQISQPENVSLSELQRAKLKLLHRFGEPAEFSDIAVGDRVVVWLANGNNLAQRVLIVKPTTYARVSGTIESVSSEPRTITMTPDGGGSITLGYSESTVFILEGVIQVEAGQSAHVIYDSDNMIAKRVVVHQEAP